MTVERYGGVTGLLERELEQHALEHAIDRACEGYGSAVVIEGQAGIGKTTLLGRAREHGAAAGMRIVGASGAELERDFPYGVVRQFFESFLFTVEAEERTSWLRGTAEMAGKMFRDEHEPSARPAEEFALLHSLYWMCVNIADERPLLMLLDDAQWSDAASLRYVEFTCRRLEQLPFLFVVATRIPDEDTPPPLLSLLSMASVEVMRLSPLSLRAVEQLVREQVDADTGDAFVQACHDVTGGNPFLLQELLREAADEHLAGSADAAARVRAIGPRGVARVMLLRLRRLPEASRRLVAALSVVPDGLGLHELAALAELDERLAAKAAAELRKAEIVDLAHGVRFTHPVIRTTVYEDIPATERRRIHDRAARMQADRGRPAAEVAVHLLEVEPRADPWVTGTLRDAAGAAARARDFKGAERLLLRARREGSDDDRAELLAELGSAEARTGNPDGIRDLEAAIRAIDDPVRSAEVSIELATALKFSIEVDRAAGVLLDAVRRLDDPSGELGRALHAELLGMRFIGPAVGERIRDELAGLPLPAGAPADRLDALLLSAAAFDAATGLRPAGEVIALGRRVLADPTPDDREARGQPRMLAATALIWAEDFAFVHEYCARALGAARATSSALGVGVNAAVHAFCSYRAGWLLEAESDVATVLELVPESPGLRTLLPAVVAYAVLCGIERDRPVEELETLASDPSVAQIAELLPYTQLLRARGELALRRERWEEALVHFTACNRTDPSFGGQNPSIVPWREGAALAHLRLGDRSSARELAADAVDRATRFGTPRALGLAMRAAALTAEGPARIAGLAAAETELVEANVPLEIARVRCDLGTALRAAGKRSDAKPVLEASYAQATKLGAVRIAERAAQELAAVGVRPRREPASGPAALTPSERRVAERAAAGNTNREIAQSLFVTQKTVETHLGHVYDKLGVRSRRKLQRALEGEPADSLAHG